jgi:hypothetical protein
MPCLPKIANRRIRRAEERYPGQRRFDQFEQRGLNSNQ